MPKLWWPSRLWAALLSFAFPGLGQMFRGSYALGVAFGAVTVAAFITLELTVFLWSAVPAAIAMVAVMTSAIALLVVSVWAMINAFCLRQNCPGRLRAWWKRWLIYAGFLLALSSRELMHPSLEWRTFLVPSVSMEPTMLAGDYVLALDNYYRTDAPTRGDLAIFRSSGSLPTDYVKRIVGIPGDAIQIKKGLLYINGAPAQRQALPPYVFSSDGRLETIPEYREMLPNGVSYRTIVAEDDGWLENTRVFTVPPRHYFVLGDNRDNSLDSRDADSPGGFIPAENLIAQPAFVYFSTNGEARWWEVWKWHRAIRWQRIATDLSARAQ